MLKSLDMIDTSVEMKFHQLSESNSSSCLFNILFLLASLIFIILIKSSFSELLY